MCLKSGDDRILKEYLATKRRKRRSERRKRRLMLHRHRCLVTSSDRHDHHRNTNNSDLDGSQGSCVKFYFAQHARTSKNFHFTQTRTAHTRENSDIFD